MGKHGKVTKGCIYFSTNRFYLLFKSEEYIWIVDPDTGKETEVNYLHNGRCRIYNKFFRMKEEFHCVEIDALAPVTVEEMLNWIANRLHYIKVSLILATLQFQYDEGLEGVFPQGDVTIYATEVGGGVLFKGYNKYVGYRALEGSVSTNKVRDRVYKTLIRRLKYDIYNKYGFSFKFREKEMAMLDLSRECAVKCNQVAERITLATIRLEQFMGV